MIECQKREAGDTLPKLLERRPPVREAQEQCGPLGLSFLAQVGYADGLCTRGEQRRKGEHFRADSRLFRLPC